MHHTHIAHGREHRVARDRRHTRGAHSGAPSGTVERSGQERREVINSEDHSEKTRQQ